MIKLAHRNNVSTRYTCIPILTISCLFLCSFSSESFKEGRIECSVPGYVCMSSENWNPQFQQSLPPPLHPKFQCRAGGQRADGRHMSGCRLGDGTHWRDAGKQSRRLASRQLALSPITISGKVPSTDQPSTA
jgi:hypothetical protein